MCLRFARISIHFSYFLHWITENTPKLYVSNDFPYILRCTKPFKSALFRSLFIFSIEWIFATFPSFGIAHSYNITICLFVRSLMFIRSVFVWTKSAYARKKIIWVCKKSLWVYSVQCIHTPEASKQAFMFAIWYIIYALLPATPRSRIQHNIMQYICSNTELWLDLSLSHSFSQCAICTTNKIKLINWTHKGMGNQSLRISCGNLTKKLNPGIHEFEEKN